MPLAISKTDGTVDIVYPVSDTDDQALDGWKTNNPGLYAGHVVVVAGELPASRQHRNAWVLQGGKLVVDPAKISSPAEPPPPVQDQLDAMRKAILTSDKSELQAIDTQLSSVAAVKSAPV